MNRIICRCIGGIAAMLLVCGGRAAAQSAAAPTAALIEGDRAEIAAIVSSAVGEVNLCGLVAEKSRDDNVRALCRKVSREDARTAITGMQLAQTIGASAAKLAPSVESNDELSALKGYTGAEFDRAFLLADIEADENDEHSIRYAAEVAGDKSVKRYENSVLPKIEDHLQLAESALRRVSEAAP